jgi:hypothetical protein
MDVSQTFILNFNFLAENLCMGSSSTGGCGTTSKFAGIIKDFAILNDALSQAEAVRSWDVGLVTDVPPCTVFFSQNCPYCPLLVPACASNCDINQFGGTCTDCHPTCHSCHGLTGTMCWSCVVCYSFANFIGRFLN